MELGRVRFGSERKGALFQSRRRHTRCYRDWSSDVCSSDLDTQLNPGIASHGGYIDLLEVREGTAYISMGGGCVGCAQVDVTLRQGVEVSIKRSVPEIVAIVDTTDHASGTNPYYQSAKK